MIRGCVLVVDDSPDMLGALADMLSSEGYAVILAVDGLDAMTKLEQLLPDLIVTDLMMPRLDGIDLMLRLSSNPVYEDVPFILMTASDLDKARSRLDDAGVSCEIIHKPFNMQDFLALVVAGVNRGHRRRRHLELTTAPASELRDEARAASAPSGPHPKS